MDAAGGTDHDNWDEHWAAYSGSASKNPAQDFRRRLILRLLGDVTPASHILDIGSGTGDLTVSLREAFPGTATLGVELSRTGVELARDRVPGAAFLQADLSGPDPLPAEYERWATHAVCSEVLEHVDDPVRVIANCRPYLAPGCRLVVTVPGGPMTEYDRHIGHRRHFGADEIRGVLTEAGLDVIEATGAGFPFFNLYRRLMRALGSRLVDIAGSTEPSVATRLGMRTFKLCLRSTRLSPRGWQTVAVARLPRDDAPH